MSRATTGFLIRPQPYIGESLSSWRQRSGWMNGYRLYPTPDERTRRVDSDIGLQTDVMTWLANSHQMSYEELQRMTLNGYVGRVIEKLSPRDQPRWWLRARYGISERAYGPMFCPRCLEADSEAYFRLIWRFGFITSCIKHSCDLLDCCPSCNRAPWPSGLGVKGNLSERFTSFRNCWHCGFDLGTASIDLNNTALTEKLLDGLSSGEVSLGQGSASIMDTLNSLWAASQIFLRKRSRERLIASGSQWGSLLQGLSGNALHERVIEGLNVVDRKILLKCAWRVIDNKEDSFLKFCREGNLKRSHFDSVMSQQPAWMSAMIEREFPSRIRPRVDEEEIFEFANSYQTLKGRLPFKYEFRQRYGLQSNHVINCLITISDSMLESKFVEFCKEIKNLLDKTKQDGTLAFKHCTYDMLTLAWSLLERRSLKDAVEISTEEMICRLQKSEANGTLNPAFKNVVRCLLEAVDQVIYLNLKAVEHVQLRQVRKRRGVLMRRLDLFPLKDHLVFASQVKTTSAIR